MLDGEPDVGYTRRRKEARGVRKIEAEAQAAKGLNRSYVADFLLPAGLPSAAAASTNCSREGALMPN